MRMCALLRSMDIKNFKSLVESMGQFVLSLTLRRLIARPPAGICDKCAIHLVDWDDDTTMHDAFASMIPQPECIDCRFSEPALLGEVGMVSVKVLERECERRVGSLPGFLFGRFDVLSWSRNVSGR